MPARQSRRLQSVVGLAWTVIYLQFLWASFLPLRSCYCVIADIVKEPQVDDILDNKEEALLDQEVKKAFEEAQRSLTAYNDVNSKFQSLSTDILEGKGKAKGLQNTIQEIEKAFDEISEKTKHIDSTIRDINAQQILALKEKIELLQTRELERRAMVKGKYKIEKALLEKKQRALQQKQGLPEGAILKEDLEEKINIKALLEESDRELEEWFLKLVEEEVQDLQDELENTVIDSTAFLNSEGAAVSTTGDQEVTEGDCSGPSLAEAVQTVQESLVRFSNDKVGMTDHLARAKVVHHLTSNNYIPPSFSYFPLEESRWFHYLPVDWERGLDSVLPEGWRRWNVAIPDYVYHTLGMTRRAKTVPPESIVQPKVLIPGSCWPMDGQTGQVTLRLPYPVQVKAVTLDQAPAMLFDDETKRQSAPKKVRVFGYPPCWKHKKSGVQQSDYLDDGAAVGVDDDDEEYVPGICDDGLDFDVQKPIVLHDFEYDINGTSIQTFHIPLPKEEKDDGGSCSEDTGTCGGGGTDILFSSPDRSDNINDGVTAIRLQVTDNWGNKDYTCIYRFRIHGDAIDIYE